ncbi:MAG: metallophosphoesterase [Candidatus Altiarchaeota archaeon]
MVAEIGIFSDSHDNLEAIRKAVDYFNNQKVELVIHAGDLVSPFAVSELAKLNMPLKIIFGNNEGSRQWIRDRLQEDMKTDISDFIELEIEARKIAVYHGTIAKITESLLKSAEYDLVVTGHTHEQLIEKAGDTVHVNPGETCGYLTGKQTVAKFDPNSMKAEIVSLN